MRIGLPREIKPHEHRVALTPLACAELAALGHQVWIEAGAGAGSGYADADYRLYGLEIAPDAAALYATSDVIVKVKEPIEGDLAYLEPRHLLFSFLHLAPNRALGERLCRIGLTAFAYETLEVKGRTPVLAPMSLIAGKLAVQIGATLLHQPHGGKGLLLGGIDNLERGKVVVLGAGSAGAMACQTAAALGARVTALDIDPKRLKALAKSVSGIDALASTPERIAVEVKTADLLIGAVMRAGHTAPHLVSRADVAAMQAGGAIVDIAIDQGGCIATAHATSYDAPTYVEEGVVHFCVTNMPGAVPRTASQALSAAIMPHLKRFLHGRWQADKALLSALNVAAGEYRHPALIEEFGAFEHVDAVR
ncbi:MAG: alanine dehydrogenase [Thiotrichales bacterium]